MSSVESVIPKKATTNSVPNTVADKATSKTINPTEKLGGHISPLIIAELKKEIDAMLSYAIYNGITINTNVNALLQNNTQEDLINAYNLLVKNVAPAKPKSIEYIKELRDNEEGKSFFYQLPLVRNLVLLTLLFLCFFVITGMSPDVNNDSLDKGVMNNNGLSLLLNIGFLASVSGLGVLFFLLKKVSTAVEEGTLVPEETISYVTQIILGIIAGLIISEIISFYEMKPDSINLFNKTVLALIGGFSSDSIFSILQGIIDKVKSIFIK